METQLDLENEELEVTASNDAETAVEKYLTFFVDSQLYTIPSSQVIEIITMQTVTYMPSLPDFVKGVINIRGKIVPLIDLCLRLKKTPVIVDDQTCVVVIEIENDNVGLIVDRVRDVTDISLTQISPAPKVAKKDKESDYLTGVAKLGQEVAMILNVQKALDYRLNDDSIAV